MTGTDNAYFVIRQRKTNKDKQRQTKTNKGKQRQRKTDEDKGRQIKTNQDKSRQMDTNQDKSRQIKTNQVKSSQIKLIPTRCVTAHCCVLPVSVGLVARHLESTVTLCDWLLLLSARQHSLLLVVRHYNATGKTQDSRQFCLTNDQSQYYDIG